MAVEIVQTCKAKCFFEKLPPAFATFKNNFGLRVSDWDNPIYRFRMGLTCEEFGCGPLVFESQGFSEDDAVKKGRVLLREGLNLSCGLWRKINYTKKTNGHMPDRMLPPCLRDNQPYG